MMQKHKFLIVISIITIFCLLSGLANAQKRDNAIVVLDSLSIEFNHLYVVLQQSSLDSIVNTPFIKEFSSFTQKNVNAGDDSWSGTYLTGQRAYLEFFAPGGFEEAEEGIAGIAFSTRKLEQFLKAKVSLISLAGDAATDGHRDRVINNDTVSWFDYLYLETPDTSMFFTWLMEFTREYLETIGVEMDSSENFDRHTYLVTKIDTLDNVPTNTTLFNDVIEIDLELNSRDYEDFLMLIQSLGITAEREENLNIFKIGDCTINVQISDNRIYCIKKVTCKLIKKITPSFDIVFGPDARLMIQDDLATWYFGLPGE
jgi:hypothetical protein